MRWLRALSSEAGVLYFQACGMHLRDMANSIYRHMFLGCMPPILFPPLPLFHGISQPNPWVEVIPP